MKHRNSAVRKTRNPRDHLPSRGSRLRPSRLRVDSQDPLPRRIRLGPQLAPITGQHCIQNQIRRRDVLLDVDGRSENRISRSIEPFPAPAIRWKQIPNLHFAPEQVANRVRILRPVDPPAHHVPAKEARVPIRSNLVTIRLLRLRQGLQPAHHLALLIEVELVLPLWRHFECLHPFKHGLPGVRRGLNLLHRIERGKEFQ